MVPRKEGPRTSVAHGIDGPGVHASPPGLRDLREGVMLALKAGLIPWCLTAGRTGDKELRRADEGLDVGQGIV